MLTTRRVFCCTQYKIQKMYSHPKAAWQKGNECRLILHEQNQRKNIGFRMTWTDIEESSANLTFVNDRFLRYIDPDRILHPRKAYLPELPHLRHPLSAAPVFWSPYTIVQFYTANPNHLSISTERLLQPRIMKITFNSRSSRLPDLTLTMPGPQGRCTRLSNGDQCNWLFIFYLIECLIHSWRWNQDPWCL